jgi:AcrR family transcriptional regulator
MSARRKSTRTRLIDAALELFTTKGVTETTTKEVAERAQVNEVTLFRHFGSKHGLLLAVMEDSANFAQLGKTLVERAVAKKSISEALKVYAEESLQALERVSELVRSVVGNAGQYPLENRLAIGRNLSQANRYVAEYLAKEIADEGWQSRLPAEKLASLLNGLLLGYFAIELTSEGHEFWEGREDFLESLVSLFLQGAISLPARHCAVRQHPQSGIAPQQITNITTETRFSSPTVKLVADLPGNLVHSILQRAKKSGRQHYAVAYVLFAGGLSVTEVVNLERSHSVSEPDRHILQINGDAPRQVPLNQWIMGKRYGSSTNNPLTQWLKSRKDDRLALFLNEEEKPMSEQELRALWAILTEGLLTLQGQTPTIEQARQTWCVEMLMKGIDLDNLSILSGMAIQELQPFAQRAREKLAIEQANRLDRKPKS